MTADNDFMPKGYRPYLPEQYFLLPPSPREWLAEDHLAYFVSDVVDQLDLTPMHAVYGEEQRAQPPYDPRMMTKLFFGPAEKIAFGSGLPVLIASAAARRACWTSSVSNRGMERS